MTREAKIGLLVGMGAIIFIGILISDHLSVAQQQNNALLTQAQPPEPVYAPQTTLPAPMTNSQLSQQDELAAPVIDLADQLNIYQLNRTDEPATESGGQDFQPDIVVQQTPGDSTLSQDGIAMIGMPASTPAAPQTASTPSRDRVHHVQQGETLWAIATQYYGDGSYYQSIYEANRDKMRSATDLRVGVRLVIPDRGGSVSTETPTSNAAPSQPSAPVVSPRNASLAKTYVVQTGDTLGELSQRFYGTSKKWRDLYNLNKDRINDPDVLIVGIELRVPG